MYSNSRKVVPLNEGFKFKVVSASNHLDSDKYSFSPLIMAKGIKFEARVVRFLKEKCGTNFVDIGGNGLNCRDIFTIERTIQAIKDGIKIIYSGVIWDPVNKCIGIPDLIVRSDSFHLIFTIDPIPESEKYISAPFLKDKKYHYRIVDIKYSTLYLRADNIHLLNHGSTRCYKGQLYIYNRALSHLQGYDPTKAYILGRRWRCPSKKKEFNNCFNKAGTINFQYVDGDFKLLVSKALRWLQKLKKDGNKWNPFCPSNKTPIELYPNMSNNKDYPYSALKKQIANSNDEITNVWMCGVKQRKLAFKQGYRKWTDPRCTAQSLGVNGKKIGPVVDSILKINKQSTDIISPHSITSVLYDWRDETNYMDFYVDFETINEVANENFSHFPYSTDLTLIFMIGVGWVRNGEVQYKSFIASNLTYNSEKSISTKFIQFVRVNTPKNKKIRLWHWSNAEPQIWKNLMKKYGLIKPGLYCDLLQIFLDEPIVIKGCLNFQLKNIARGMAKYSLIPTSSLWATEDCTNGENAMIAGREAYNRNIPVESTCEMAMIIEYNKCDCMTLYEILTYLRCNL
jgi:hypothetical protein